MRLRVEFAKKIIQDKHYRECAFWLAARHHFKVGYFLDTESSYKQFGNELGVSSRTARRLADRVHKAGFTRGRDRKKRIYFNSMEAVYKRYDIQTVSAFEISTENLKHFREFVFAAYVEHLKKSRRHRRKKDVHESSWIQSAKKGDALTAVLGRSYHPSMLSVTYLSKALSICPKTVHELKHRAKKRGLLKFNHLKIPLDGMDAGLRAGLKENTAFGSRIVFERGKYCLNHTDLFLNPVHPFRFSSDKRRAERV